MSELCTLLVLLLSQAGGGLDDARLMIQRGLLSESQQRLEAVLADETDLRERAWALLLLGNVEYERAHYERALEHYLQAEQSAGADSQLLAGAQGNRVMAEERLARSVEIGGQVTRLRVWLIAVTLLGGIAVACLARNAHPSVSTKSAPR